jgi:regulator of protease activity HflC (stomatin/prohibitin superfamily)
MKTALASIFAAILLFTGLVWLANSNNVQAPAGYATYVVERPVLGSTTFHSVIIGPSSTGLSWRLYGDHVSVTPYSYSEEFKDKESVIAKDKLAMIMNAHVVWRIRVDQPNETDGEHRGIRDYMEHFGGLDEAHSADEVARLAYENYIKEPFRTMIRAEGADQNGLDIPDHVADMSVDITNKLRERLANTPFEILQVVIGNAQPPQTVLDQIAMKVAKTQEFARKATEQAIANANKAIEQANGQAEGERALAVATQRALANKTLSDSITPQLLQYNAIENMKGAERIYVPTGSNGLPVVGTLPLDTTTLSLPTTK